MSEAYDKEDRRVVYWCVILSGVAYGIYMSCYLWLTGDEPFTWLSVGWACAQIVLGSLMWFVVLWVIFRIQRSRHGH